MRTLLGLLLLAAGAVAQTPAADAVDATGTSGAKPDASVYCVTNLADLTVVEGTRPSPQADDWWRTDRPQPYVALEGPGEAFVIPPQPAFNALEPERGAVTATRVGLRLPTARDVAGRLFLEGDDGALVALRFTVPAASFSNEARPAFDALARDHYRALRESGLPGAAWWRHRSAHSSERAGGDPPDDGANLGFPGMNRTPSNMDDTFELFSGSRAIAENLQLDRTLPATPKDGSELTRAVADIPGITVSEYDWTAAIAGLSPELDPLAALIPADQHAVFFPSFQALVDVADQADAQATPVLQAMSDPTGEAGTKERYQRQLGLPMSDLARLLGPTLIDSVALTGGDPYLTTGSDVALLFEAKDATVLQPLVLARVAAAAAAAGATATPRQGAIDDVDFVAYVSPDRTLSSFVLVLGDAVVVSNSEAQVRRLVAVSKGQAPALSAQPDYIFFRSRYVLGAPEESALLVLSDATIRRWCGPRWRIGDSRRTRAAAELAEAQARWIDTALGNPDAGESTGIGSVTESPAGARSSIYGSLSFMTPIAELDLSLVSEEEADLYGRWRDGYQQNWSGKFDPIAVRFGVAPGRLAADVTVRPLIAGSDYREFIELARGARIAPLACDPHDDALLHWALAIDKQAPLLGEQSSMLSMMMPEVDALGWLGQSISIYADDDPFWDELAAAEDTDDFMERNWPRLPVALHAEVSNGLLLTAFLVGVRGMVEQSAPDMTIWENHTYRDEPYVSLRPSPRALEDARGFLGEDNETVDQAALYYAASGEGLVLSLNRSVIEHALDRRLQRKAAVATASPTAAPSATTPSPWLGDQLCLRVQGKAFSVLGEVFGDAMETEALRGAAFANLPILNEWHRLYPGEDPVAVHERLWQRRLLCPGGGVYRWNDEWQTMESSVYGHPGDQRDGPKLPPALARIVSVAAGLTFEADGLRARFELKQEP